MYLCKSKSDRFYRLLHALVEFIESRYHITGVPQTLDAFSSQEDVMEIMEAIAGDPTMIDEFLACTSLDLSDQDKKILRQWKHSYSGTFLIKGYANNGNAFMVSPFGLISVKGITQEISDMIPDTPAMVSTILLPFEDSITYAMNIMQCPIDFGEGMKEMFREWDEKEANDPIIHTAANFIEKLDEYIEEQSRLDVEELEKQMSRETAKANGTLEPAKGFHKGELASCTPHEREAKYRERFKADRNDEGLEHYLNDICINKKPRETLRECLECYTKTKLQHFACELDIDLDYSEKKPEIIDMITSFLLDKEQLMDCLLATPSYITNSYIEILREKGRIEFTLEEATEKSIPIIEPPISFLFKADKEYTVCIPTDLKARLEELDLESILDFKLKMDFIGRRFGLAAQLYGIIDLGELFATLSAELELSLEEMNIVFLHLILSKEREFSTRHTDGRDFIICYELDPLECLDEPVDDLDLVEQAMEAYQDHILKRQKEIGLRPLIDTDKTLFEWVYDLPSAHNLVHWLDAHVPDEADDYHYADAIIEDIYDLTRGPFKPTDLPELLQRHGAFSDDLDEANELLSLTTKFMNDIPIWENAGWSPNELIEKRTGKKLFYNETGAPMKIGRNDPCPCGSGKKYKKCCGA